MMPVQFQAKMFSDFWCQVNGWAKSIGATVKCEECSGGQFYYAKCDKPLAKEIIGHLQLLEIWDTENISDNME